MIDAIAAVVAFFGFEAEERGGECKEPSPKLGEEVAAVDGEGGGGCEKPLPKLGEEGEVDGE